MSKKNIVFIMTDEHRWDYMGYMDHPTTGALSLQFDLPESEHVTVRVFNLLGQPMQTVADRTFRPGSHRLRWSSTGLSSGKYLVTFRGTTEIRSWPVVVVR